MHGPSVCRKAFMRKVSRKWERCILGVYEFRKGILYDRLAVMVCGQMIRVYGVRRILLKAVQNFYVDSR